MKKVILLSLCLSSFIIANEPNKAYIDMNHVWLNYSNNGTTTDFKPTGFKWTGGYVFKDFDFASVAIEGSLMLGVNNDSKSSVTLSNGNSLTNAEATLDKMYSLHIKGILPITKGFNANLYLGGTRGKLLSSSNQSKSKSSFENSFSYGGGLEYWTSANVSVYGNYMQYFKNLDAVEFGIGFRF